MYKIKREDLRVGDIIRYMGDINIIEEILTENCEIESFNCSLYDKDKNKFISVNWEIADEVNKLDDSEVLEWKSRLI